MQILQGFSASQSAVLAANARRAFSSNPQIEAEVRSLCEAVQTRGDAALIEQIRRFDCADFELKNLRVSSEEIESAWAILPDDAKCALQRAAENIEIFHQAQKPRDFAIETIEGATLGGRYLPVKRAGIYAPNGRAAYPSTVLMLAIPARVAGVQDVVLATPAGQNGRAHPVILAAAKIAGISEIYKMGGAGAVAALGFGTETVQKVEKIAGPGSIYFTLAKKQLFGIVGIDGLYGPSEVAIVADENQNPAQLAADLLAQAEHGADSFVVFLSPSQLLCDAVAREIETQIQTSSRADFLRASLENSLVCTVETMEQACELANVCAAEHVEIWSDIAPFWATEIRDAGAIFLNTPVPFGDYILGPSHTLPTGLTTRFASGVGVDTFLKRTTMVEAPQSALQSLSGDLEILALLEKLPGHGAAAKRAGLEQFPL